MSQLRKFIKNSDLLNELHGPFFPEDIREDEKIYVELNVINKEQTYKLQVWRISPLGIELITKEKENILQGEKVNIKLNYGNENQSIEGLVIDKIHRVNDRNIIGIRLVAPKEQARDSSKERRASKRWLTTNQFLPTGMAPNPAKFNDFLYFKVKDISSNGMQITTSLRNKFIIKGMTFDSSISFPMISQVRAKFKVENIRIINENNKEQLSLGVTLLNKTTDLMDVIGQYLIQFSNVKSMTELHAEGISPTTLNKSVQFSYVKDEDDYKEVLKLRYLANKHAKQITGDIKPSDFSDIYDARSRIVVGKLNGVIVATGRMTFCNFDQPMEMESYVKWDETLPRREDSVEIMKVCTHPEFKGSDLIILMYKYMAKAVVQSKRKWVVLGCTDKYLNMYKKIGGVPTGRKYKVALLNDVQAQLVIGNVQKSLLGKNINPIIWNYVYASLVDYLNKDLLMSDVLDNLRVSLYRYFAPLTNFIFDYYITPKKILKNRLKNIKGGS